MVRPGPARARGRAVLVLVALAWCGVAMADPVGRPATTDEIAAWNIDVRPDGQGLPPGSGSVTAGEAVYVERCAACHGAFGEGAGRWPMLAGGRGSLAAERPERTVGSFWPHATTLFDYIRRAMPHGGARSLDDDAVYAVTAYILYLNDVLTDESFVLTPESLASLTMPNATGFVPDTRDAEPRVLPCQTACTPGPVGITARAPAQPWSAAR